MALVALAVIGTAAGCTDPEPITQPTTVPPTGEQPETAAFVDYVPPDHRNVVIAPIPPGKPAKVPPVEVYGGEATLTGTISYNGQAAPDATIQIERFVGLNSSTVTVASRADGSWGATKLRGGRYRIRAFVGSELTLQEAVTLFLAEKEARDLPLTLVDVPRTEVTVVRVEADRDPDVGVDVSLKFWVTSETRLPDGTVESEEPVSDRQITVEKSPNWLFPGSKTGVTGPAGGVSFKARCVKTGAYTGSVKIGVDSVEFEFPECGSNKPKAIDLPVGDSFTVPEDGPIPAGTYESGDPACATTFELWENGNWSGKRSIDRGRKMELPNIARTVEAAGGSTPCTYERVS